MTKVPRTPSAGLVLMVSRDRQNSNPVWRYRRSLTTEFGMFLESLANFAETGY